MFSPRTGHFLFIFSVSLSFSLSPFGPPSFSVSLSLSLFFLLFFLSSFLSLFLLSFGSLFLSLFCFFLFLLAFLSWKEQHQNIKLQVFFLKSFLFLSFLPFFLSSSFFLSLLFPDFKLCFLFNIKVFGFKTKNLKKKTIFGQKGGCNKTGFFINLCFAKCQKLSFFFGHFLDNFWLMFKKHYKNWYFSTILKAKNEKKRPFLIVTNWATLIVTNWATFVQLKNGQRGPVSNY